jgi:DNA modification methylase
MSETTPGCAHCLDRETKRELRGTPDKDYAPYDPARSDLPNPPASWAKRDATVSQLAMCSKCGATRTDQQLGLEPTPEAYVARMVEVFREVRRVLADHGTCWVNLGDSYNTSKSGEGGAGSSTLHGPTEALNPSSARRIDRFQRSLKSKDLVGIPWKIAQALQAPYYTGRVPLERDRVWLAATLDAEGTICGFRHDRKDDGRTRTGAHVFVTNGSTAMLDEAERIWPASRSEHGRPGPGHLGEIPTYRWIVHGIENKIAFLREVYPHLIVKRSQAVLAYNLLVLMSDAKRAARTPQHGAILEKRSLLVRLLSEANHGGADVPSWCVEPPTLFESGWYLRSDIIWSKPNPMPESVTDRPTKAHEYIFMLSKGPRYFFDQEAVREKAIEGYDLGILRSKKAADGQVPTSRDSVDKRLNAGIDSRNGNPSGSRNIRSVWDIATQPYPEAHFATYPEELVRRCVLAGSPEYVCTACYNPVVSGRQQKVTEPQAVQEDVRRVRDSLRGSESEVLQPPLLDEGSRTTEAAEAETVRVVQGALQPPGPGQVLLPEVLERMGDGDGSSSQTAVDGETPAELEGREDSRGRLHQGLRPAVEAVHVGASPGDGGEARSAPSTDGVRSSQEWDQVRQSTRESRVDDSESTSRHSRVPALRGDILDSLSPCCGAAMRPGVVLDPFLGSGTTALVARKHGRHSIGIELNSDYCELAAKRLAQLSLLAA